MRRRIEAAAGPVRERPDRDHVRVVLAVGVRQHSAQQRDQLRRPAAVWTWQTDKKLIQIIIWTLLVLKFKVLQRAMAMLNVSQIDPIRNEVIP